MPQKRPDTPLANTPEPVKIDKTYVRKPKVPDVKKEVKPTYKNVEADVAIYRGGKPYSKKDSLDYKKGFAEGLKGKSFTGPFESGSYTAGKLEGLNKRKEYPKKK